MTLLFRPLPATLAIALGFLLGVNVGVWLQREWTYRQTLQQQAQQLINEIRGSKVQHYDDRNDR